MLSKLCLSRLSAMNRARLKKIVVGKLMSTEVIQSQADAVTPAVRKPVTNIPFVKNLFVGRFEKDMLIYPELSAREEVDELNQMVKPIEKFFSEGVDSKSIDQNAEIPEKVLQQIKDLGLFGQQIPVEYGGLGLNATKYARIAEATALDGAVAVTLAAHQAIGLKGILIAGSDQQKAKYLPKLASGAHIAAFCLTEPSSGSDAASVKTRATQSPDGKHYLLNGEKIWISNGGIAEIFTVFARTEVKDNDGKTVDKITAFIVERAFGGVTNGKPEDKLGIRGSNTCSVHFDNTPVPAENVLGEVGGGFKLAMNILNSGRFSMGSSGAGMLKKLLSLTTKHAIERSQFGKKLSEFGLIQEKIARMAVTIYAMESMAYLTAGVIDMYQQPDMSVEAAIVKVFSSEGCWMCVSECLQILGGLGYMKGYPYERYLRDSRILLIFEGTNEILQLYIALNGVQHAGKELKELVKKLRNPLNNVGFVFSKAVEKLQDNIRPNLKLHLDQEVHPSLKAEALTLETNLKSFQRAVELLLSRHGNEIVNDQMDLKRLASIAIDLYAMTACIGRSSRSYCIGLRNADHEMMLTRTFCHDANTRIQQRLLEIHVGKVKNMDEIYCQIAQTIFSNQGWATAHPLDHNW